MCQCLPSKREQRNVNESRIRARREEVRFTSKIEKSDAQRENQEARHVTMTLYSCVVCSRAVSRLQSDVGRRHVQRDRFRVEIGPKKGA